MNYSFEYIDIILLAMIAGFIFLRLRGILGKRTGFDGKTPQQFENILKKVHQESKIKQKENFDEEAQKEFLKGAKIAYETIITDFSDNDNKLIASKPLLSKEIYEEFNKALKDRSERGHFAEITFIGIKSADIKEHKKVDRVLKVTVDFVSEIITCIKDKEKKIVSGSPDKIKTIYDTWVFSRDVRSNNPNWLLVNTLNWVNSKISDKDKEEWEKFLSKNEKLTDKDNLENKKVRGKIKSLDLHGFTLEDANNTVENFIRNAFEENISKLIIVTGKGLHSNNEKDPYVSKDLSILKYSIPEFINNHSELMTMIYDIKDANIEDGGAGAFYIYLKKNLKMS